MFFLLKSTSHDFFDVVSPVIMVWWSVVKQLFLDSSLHLAPSVFINLQVLVCVRERLAPEIMDGLAVFSWDGLQIKAHLFALLLHQIGMLVHFIFCISFKPWSNEWLEKREASARAAVKEGRLTEEMALLDCALWSLGLQPQARCVQHLFFNILLHFAQILPSGSKSTFNKVW